MVIKLEVCFVFNTLMCGVLLMGLEWCKMLCKLYFENIF